MSNFLLRAATSNSGEIPEVIKKSVEFWENLGFQNKSPYAPIDDMGGCLLKRGDFVAEITALLKKSGYVVTSKRPVWWSKPVWVDVNVIKETRGQAAGCTVITLLKQ